MRLPFVFRSQVDHLEEMLQDRWDEIDLEKRRNGELRLQRENLLRDVATLEWRLEKTEIARDSLNRECSALRRQLEEHDAGKPAW